MSHPRAALLVVDAQQSFEHRPYWSESHAPAFLDRLQALVEGAKARHIPVVQIFHVEESGAFSLESGYVKTLAALSIAPDVIFHKQRHSALIGSGLPVWLTERGIQHLMVSGIRTEQCCETTTRHASDCGYSVDFVSEATLTFAMTDRHGRHWTAEDIKARTELVLDERFARVLTANQALAAFDLAAEGAGRKAA
ncbi:MAG TPA: isochorismatase family protein [Steroidobacteraceae bacterium]|jgi:nicotinamidase-related amidase|nr:isochorismatase family protein [Steroidobacteraceae bacterium]